MKNIALLFLSMLLSTAMLAGKGHTKFKLFFTDNTGEIALENAHVTVYQDGVQVLDHDFKGHSAKFKMKNNHRYIVVVKKEGYADYYLAYDLTKADNKDSIGFDSVVFFGLTNECASVTIYDSSAQNHFIHQAMDVADLKAEIHTH